MINKFAPLRSLWCALCEWRADKLSNIALAKKILTTTKNQEDIAIMSDNQCHLNPQKILFFIEEELLCEW